MRKTPVKAPKAPKPKPIKSSKPKGLPKVKGLPKGPKPVAPQVGMKPAMLGAKRLNIAPTAGKRQTMGGMTKYSARGFQAPKGSGRMKSGDHASYTSTWQGLNESTGRMKLGGKKVYVENSHDAHSNQMITTRKGQGIMDTKDIEMRRSKMGPQIVARNQTQYKALGRRIAPSPSQSQVTFRKGA